MLRQSIFTYDLLKAETKLTSTVKLIEKKCNALKQTNPYCAKTNRHKTRGAKRSSYFYIACILDNQISLELMSACIVIF